MCVNYDPVIDNERLLTCFGVSLPESDPLETPGHAGAMAPFITRADMRPTGMLGDVKLGLLGLLPHFAIDTGLAKHTAHCPIETMKSKPAFRESWWVGRRCVIPAQRLSAWSYESGQPEMWHIQLVDDKPMGLAGLWSEWLSPSGEKVLSFSVLTIRADGHPVFSRMNGPDHDKRMPVILPSHVQEPWLYGSLKEAEPLLRHCPAQQLQAVFHASLTKARYAPKSWESMPDMFASEWHVLASAQPHKPLARAPRVVPPQPPDRASPTTGELF